MGLSSASFACECSFVELNFRFRFFFCQTSGTGESQSSLGYNSYKMDDLALFTSVIISSDSHTRRRLMECNTNSVVNVSGVLIDETVMTFVTKCGRQE